MGRSWIAVFVVMACLYGVPAAAETCAQTCRGLSREHGWKRSETVGCTKSCKRAQRECRGLEGIDRRACRDDLKRCAEQCTAIWPVGAVRTDREYCQFICAECGRDLATFCIEAPDAARLARCCGREGEGSCCSHAGLLDPPECCAAGSTCCVFGGCIDTQTDTRHCGDCGQACAGADVCVDGICRPPSCDEPLVGTRSMTETRTGPGANGQTRTLTVTAVFDPCGIVVNGQCSSTTTLVCTLDGAEVPCTPNSEGFITNGMFDSAISRGAFCAADAVPCSGSCTLQLGNEQRSYACTGCIAPECEATAVAACACYAPGGCVSSQ
jgi:hypothetical protein